MLKFAKLNLSIFYMKFIRKTNGYKWSFSNVGGTPRVRIETGEDIAHLPELDPKMWTVLSCPVKGLEISDKSLAYVDVDADGKIRINDVVATSKWLTGLLKDNNLILGRHALYTFQTIGVHI